MTYDTKSYELAEHFLPDGASKELKHELAQEIQRACEDFLTDKKIG